MRLIINENGYEKHAALLKKTIETKIPVQYSEDGMAINLQVNEDLGAAESYLISDTNGEWTIVGSDEAGLYYGIGKFLHSAKWRRDEFVPNPPIKVMTPAHPFRATYFSVHFYNWYHMAPTDELSEYLETMLLWGYNTIVCILPIVNFNDFDD